MTHVTTSFNTTMAQMTEMSRRKKSQETLFYCKSGKCTCAGNTGSNLIFFKAAVAQQQPVVCERDDAVVDVQLHVIRQDINRQSDISTYVANRLVAVSLQNEILLVRLTPDLKCDRSSAKRLAMRQQRARLSVQHLDVGDVLIDDVENAFDCLRFIPEKGLAWTPCQCDRFGT